jgi:hypothetical protein
MAVAAEERPRCCACGAWLRRRPDWHGALSETEVLDDTYQDHDCSVQGGYVVPGGGDIDVTDQAHDDTEVVRVPVPSKVARVYTLERRRRWQPSYTSPPLVPALPPAYAAREDWLRAARDIMVAELFPEAGLSLNGTRTRVACGWPATSDRSVLGATFTETVSGDGTREIFVSPVVAKPARLFQGVLFVLLHELVHAALGAKEGHGPAFDAAMKQMGAKGDPSCNGADTDLDDWFAWSLLPRLGPYPHAEMNLGNLPAPTAPPGFGGPGFKFAPPHRKVAPRQRNRHKLYECDACGQKIRAGTDDLDAVHASRAVAGSEDREECGGRFLLA